MVSTQKIHPGNQRVAVVLAGCGAKDGSEITEAVGLLIALSQKGLSFDCFAPDRKTHDVVDHLTSKASAHESRNQLHEAARIARGRIQPISELKAVNYAAVALAGGFGAAKNLCNYAFAGVDARLEEDVKAALLPFIQNKKPMAALCIAPVVLALICREAHVNGAQLTLGDGSAQDAVKAIEGWGAKHMPTRPGEACVDHASMMVSAPAYMFDDATPADVFASAVALVDGLKSLLSS
ncbi:MAG: isoprenoid biosynthesis glyoxalase ElbB [Silvanigrellaceae bacterium]